MKEANFLYYVIASLVVGTFRDEPIYPSSRHIADIHSFALRNPGGGGKRVDRRQARWLQIYHTFFFIIVPIVGGGIGEGILPPSLAYSATLAGTGDRDPVSVQPYVADVICPDFHPHRRCIDGHPGDYSIAEV